VAKTLLAVDDSVTMRKVLEITFSGEDFRVITAESAQSALGKLGENPGVFVIDTVLGGDDGYALAKEVRRRDPGVPIIMLASRYAPYDQARGRDAGADDWADKPFDTQQLIDKVKKAVLAKEAATPPSEPRAPEPPRAPPPVAANIGGAAQGAGAPYRAPAAPQAPAAAGPQSGALGRGAQPSLGGSPVSSARSGTLVFGESPVAPPVGQPVPPRPAAPAAPQAAAAPATSPLATTRGTAATTGGAVSAAVNGQLAGKLGELGLTSAQADAVLALSREVVERVVWEVVPQLAETLIKEELQRLLKE
jgi:CheY-like chemotaxis protein